MPKRLCEIDGIFGRRINPETRTTDPNSEKHQYLVRWKGASLDDSSWLPEHKLRNARELMTQFYATLNRSSKIKKPRFQGATHRRYYVHRDFADEPPSSKEVQEKPISVSPSINRETKPETAQISSIKRPNEGDQPQGDGESEDSGQVKGQKGDTQVTQEINGSHDFAIVGMCRRSTAFFYLVVKDGVQQWMPREEVVDNHSPALLAFYERNLTFAPQ